MESMRFDNRRNRRNLRIQKEVVFLMRVSMFGLIILLSATVLAGVRAAANESGMEGFGVKEYDDFHHVLHPLQHEALPKKDFSTIRARAPELTKLGEMIIRLGVPRDTRPENVEEFKKGLNKFANALVDFKTHARTGTDDQLEKSFGAVHDSFEMLAGMLPTSATQATTQSSRVIIYDGVPTNVSAASEPSSDLWITTKDLASATRFVIKPQGVCRDELCFPLPKARKDAFVKKKGSTTWFNLSEFARLIKQPFASDEKNGVWYFGERSEQQNGYLASREAPDFTLPDLNGRMHSLRDFRGKKVLLVTWASW